MLNHVLNILDDLKARVGQTSGINLYVDLPPILGELNEGYEVSNHVMEWETLFSDKPIVVMHEE